MDPEPHCAKIILIQIRPDISMPEIIDPVFVKIGSIHSGTGVCRY
jgi:hypothetical protein